MKPSVEAKEGKELRREIQFVLDSLRRIVQALRVAASDRPQGLSSAQLYVLTQLLARPASSINELADRTYTHQSSVSAVVGRLTRRGLVVRRASAEDGRRKEIALTGKGRARVEQLREPTQTQLLQALIRLNAKDRTALAKGLAALVSRMSLDPGPPAMFFEKEPKA